MSKWVLFSGGILVVIWLFLFVQGVQNYSGSAQVYIGFSLAFLFMLLSGIYGQISYSYLFLVSFLWLGFWLKLTIHTIFEFRYGEPVGYFVGSVAAWDEVLVVAMVASVGVVVGRIIYSYIGIKANISMEEKGFQAPLWYLPIRQWLWVGLIVAIIGLGVTNVVLGIQIAGLVPRTILLWPLNAMISLSLSMGLAMAVVTLLWWDVALRKNVSLSILVMLLAAFISTVSLLSRAVYIFNTIPLMVVLFWNRKLLIGYTWKNIIFVGLLFVSLLGISLSVVNTLRSHYYSGTPLIFFEINGVGRAVGNGMGNREANGSIKFTIDRWIGVEGVMAVASYPGKSAALFARAATERAEIGKTSLYQDVCQSQYRFIDTSKFQFGSLPGVVGFLYYSGSMWMVGLGMLMFALVVSLSEVVIFSLTGNPIMCGLLGAALANFVAQFGLAPRQAGPYWSMIFCGIVVVWFLQSKYFHQGLKRLGYLTEEKA